MFNKIFDKLFLKQWAIGIGRFELNQLFFNGIDGIQFKWIEPENNFNLKADPFITKTEEGDFRIFYENFSYFRNYGNINCYTLNNDLKIVDHKEVINIGSHLSYPFTIKSENSTIIIPESSKAENLFVRVFSKKDLSVSLDKTIIPNQKLLDSTIIFHNGKYWLFATKRGIYSNRKLYIYHSERWDGEFQPHKKNPVKNNVKGSRPAGSIFSYQNSLYRPAQNCKEYYGKSIIINKIRTLNENEFEEEECIEITAQQKGKYNFGLHTINFIDNVIVIDGLSRKFAPISQLIILLNKLFLYPFFLKSNKKS